MRAAGHGSGVARLYTPTHMHMHMHTHIMRGRGLSVERLARQAGAVVRNVIVDQRALGHDAVRVDLPMAAHVVVLEGGHGSGSGTRPCVCARVCGWKEGGTLIWKKSTVSWVLSMA